MSNHNDTNDNNTAPQWELCKENAAPLEHGRNAAKLSQALAPNKTSTYKTQNKAEDDDTIRQFESLVRSSERFSNEFVKRQRRRRQRRDDAMIKNGRKNHGNNDDDDDDDENEEEEVEELLSRCGVGGDPIVNWLRYIKYVEETYPSDTHGEFQIMERCTRALTHHPLYKNDIRFVRVCILYADRTSTPNDTFKYLHKHGIGGTRAVFWMAWAWTAEKRKDFPFAEKIFWKAKQKKAKPLKLVEDRFKQFQRRMSRHWLNNSKAQEEGGDDMDGADQENGGQENRRGALSGLTEEGVRYNHRGRAANSMASSGVSNNRMKSVPQQKEEKEGGFKIYTGSEDKENGDYDLNQSMAQQGEADIIPHQTLLAKEEHRVKENNITAERWNERGGLQTQGYDDVQVYNDNEDYTATASSVAQRWAGTDTDARVAGGTSVQQAFQVYVDEECVAKNEKEKEESLKEETRGLKSSSLLRQRMDGMSSIHDRPFPVQHPSSTASSRLKMTTQQSLGSRARPPSSREVAERAQTQAPIIKKTNAKNDSREKAVCGFDKKLVNQGNNGEETCFEECRASMKYYKIVSPDENFNMLHCKDDCSFMDVDELSTIQDVSMEDSSLSRNMVECDSHRKNDSKLYAPQNISILKESFDNGNTGKVSEQRKVLFGMNTTIESQSNSYIQSLSVASSTVNDQDAVGVVGEKEETINTKFAARELSMMFSSPAATGHGNDISIRTSAVKLNMSTLQSKPLFSVHGKRREGRVDFDKSWDDVTPKQLHRTDSYRKKSVKKIRSSSGENSPDAKSSSAFPIFCDDDNTKPDTNGSINDCSDLKASSAIPIFCDDDNDKPGPGNDCSDVKSSYAIPIFCDDDNDEPGNNCSNTKTSSAFPIFCDDDKAEQGKNEPGYKSLDVKISSAFPIFCDDDNGEPDEIVVPADENNNKILQSRTTNQFTIFEEDEAEGRSNDTNEESNTETASFGGLMKGMDDSLSSSSGDEENENTVETMALLNIMNDYDEVKPLSPIKSLGMKSNRGTNTFNQTKEKNEFPKYFDQDDSAVLTEDLLAFGDISQITRVGIATGSSLEENMQDMAISQNDTGRKGSIDYKALHLEVSEEAFEDMMDIAAKQQKEKSGRQPGCVTIFDRTNKILPKALRKVPRKGTEIDIGGFGFVVKSLLGRGAYGTVLLCDSTASSRRNFALKVQIPAGCLAWEYEILDRLDQRVRSSKRTLVTRNDVATPFPRVQSFVAFSDGGVMGMTAGSDLGATLVDVVNAYEGSAVPELVAIHYTSRMLLHLETLHLKGKVLHCDIKPDNWVLTSSDSPQNSGDSRSSPIGSDLMLVDFGRALDLTAITASSIDPLLIDLHGNIAAKDMECAAMRQDRSWNVDLDTYGVCASAHVLLFGSYMDICENNRSKRWEPKKKFRRYWQQDLWHHFFDTLLNVNGQNSKLRLGEYGKKLRHVREAFEDYLDESRHRKEVVTLLREQGGKLYKKN